jgi:hypothetical protein
MKIVTCNDIAQLDITGIAIIAKPGPGTFAFSEDELRQIKSKADGQGKYIFRLGCKLSAKETASTIRPAVSTPNKSKYEFMICA